MEFNPRTNRIIGGVCEYCGIPADRCPHYAGQAKPIDYREALSISENAPIMPKVAIEPLKEEEKAKSLEEFKAKTDEFKKKEAKKKK